MRRSNTSHFPHSSLSTPRVFHAPHFPHSAPRVFHRTLIQLFYRCNVWKINLCQTKLNLVRLVAKVRFERLVLWAIRSSTRLFGNFLTRAFLCHFCIPSMPKCLFRSLHSCANKKKKKRVLVTLTEGRQHGRNIPTNNHTGMSVEVTVGTYNI